MLAVLLCGMIISVLCGLPQLHPGEWLGTTVGQMLGKKDGRTGREISAFQTATAALAGTIGTGNIVGVAAALSAGGPPAIFWMWVSAAVSMGVSYAENRLGTQYRIPDGSGGYIGGPMLYIAGGLGMRRLAGAWAAVCVLASFGVGNTIQVNAITVSAYNAFGCPRWLSGALICMLAAPAVLGGVKGTVRLTEKLVPLMAAGYIAACAAVIVMNIGRVPEAFGMILSGVLRPRAAGSGIFCGMLEGVRRGVFTNEAGMGSSVMINASADSSDPRAAGCWGMLEVFVDTMIMCTLTALTLIVSGAYTGAPGNGSKMSAAAFAGVFGKASGAFISVCLLLFAFSTLISWGVTGERACRWVLGGGSSAWFRAIYVSAIIPGALLDAGAAWAAADTINACMLLPNMASVLMLVLPEGMEKPGSEDRTSAARAGPAAGKKEKNMEKSLFKAVPPSL